MSPSQNDPRPRCRSRSGWVIVGDPFDVRVKSFQEALVRQELPEAAVIDYRQLLAGDFPHELVAPGSILRIESPGRDFGINKAMLARGAAAAAAEGGPVLDSESLAGLLEEKGRILGPRQWYLGFCSVLEQISAALAGRDAVTLTSHPEDIAVMFDKRRCHSRLAEAGIAVPAALPAPRDYDELRQAMTKARRPRVFVKLNHGSAASGVVAFETSPRFQQAWTTVELVHRDGQAVLYNSRRLQRYTEAAKVVELLNAVCALGVHVEAWFPKAGLAGGTCDLRVLTIAGQPAHTVARVSRGPMTNLHLLNRRADPELLRQRMPPSAWEALLDTCRRAAAQFPRTLHAGIDVAVSPDYRSHAVLEVNAFGDLLKNVTHAGLDSYTAQVQALLEGSWHSDA